MNQFDLNDNFKKNVGDFILTFSEIEFNLCLLVSYLENGVDTNPLIPKIVGLSLDDKRKRIRNGLSERKSFLTIWNKIDGKLADCNEFRRLIAHGIIMNHMPNPSLQAIVKAKPRNGIEGFILKEINNDELIAKYKKLTELYSGKNGIVELINNLKKAL